VVAKFCKAKEEGENWTVECGRLEDLKTGTIVQVVPSGDELGAQGAMATWQISGSGVDDSSVGGTKARTQHGEAS
jgi:hypothetical protein